MKDNILIIGAGGMARAIAYDLLNFSPRHNVTILDRDSDALNRLAEYLGNENVRVVKGDATDHDLLTKLMSTAIAAIGAASYNLHFDACEIAIGQGTHWVDLGGNPTVVQKQFALHEKAVAAGVGVVPDSGLAPGLINVVGGYIASQFDEIDELHFRVGGLPQNPQPPLFYGLVFSPEGLANEYHEPAWVIENSEVKTVESLTGWERVYVGSPLGNLEAFHTAGGSSTMVETFAGRVKALDYKTLRYPGHLRKIKLLGDLGFWGEELVEVKIESGKCKDGKTKNGKLKTETNAGDTRVMVAPRNVMGALLVRKGIVSEDLVVLMGWGIGRKAGKLCRVEVKMIDYADTATGLTSMARTTGFPATLVARMLVEGTIKATGVLRQEVSVPAEAMFKALGDRGVGIDIS